jgi:hypothetical protein
MKRPGGGCKPCPAAAVESLRVTAGHSLVAREEKRERERERERERCYD